MKKRDEDGSGGQCSKLDEGHRAGEGAMHDSRVTVRPRQQVAALHDRHDGEGKVAGIDSSPQLSARSSFLEGFCELALRVFEPAGYARLCRHP